VNKIKYYPNSIQNYTYPCANSKTSSHGFVNTRYCFRVTCGTAYPCFCVFWCSAWQDIPHSLQNPQVHYHIQNSPPL